jgi:hypothetical protein
MLGIILHLPLASYLYPNPDTTPHIPPSSLPWPSCGCWGPLHFPWDRSATGTLGAAAGAAAGTSAAPLPMKLSGTLARPCVQRRWELFDSTGGHLRGGLVVQIGSAHLALCLAWLLWMLGSLLAN